MKLDAIEKEKEELRNKDAVQIFLSQYQQELKIKMFTAVSETNKWKRGIISYHDAQ